MRRAYPVQSRHFAPPSSECAFSDAFRPKSALLRSLVTPKSFGTSLVFLLGSSHRCTVSCTKTSCNPSGSPASIMDAEDGSRPGGPPGEPYVDREEPVYAPTEALQYAYEHDLTRDYTLNSFSIAHLLSKTVQSTLPSITEDGFTDCSHLPDLELPVPQLRSEVLTIAHSALKLIHETRRELTDDEVKSLTQDVTDSGNTKKWKLELPLLRTNNERDMREFHKGISSRRHVHIGDHRLPLDPVTVEDGEGMQLPASARSEANELLRKLEGEKLGVTRSSLQFLANVVKDEYSEQEQWKFLLRQVMRTKWVKVSNHESDF